MKQIKYEIIENYFTIECDYGSIQLNLMKWNTGSQKYDLRRWDTNGEPKKGIVLSEGELANLLTALNKSFDVEEHVELEQELVPVPEVVIDYRSLVVVNNLYQCQQEGHNIEAVNALIYTRDVL